LLPAGHTCGEFLLAPLSLARADRAPGDRKRTWQDCDRRHAVSPRLRFGALKRAFPPRAVRVEVREVSTMRDLGGDGMHETYTAPWMTAADSRRVGKTALSSAVCDRARRRYQVCLRLGFGGPVAACCFPPCSHDLEDHGDGVRFPTSSGGAGIPSETRAKERRWYAFSSLPLVTFAQRLIGFYR
jgi:hypothetical protein